MRGLLLDRGIAIAVAATRARRLIPQILSEPNDELTDLMREIVSSLYAFMLQIDDRVRVFDKQIDGFGEAARTRGTVHDAQRRDRRAVGTPQRHAGIEAQRGAAGDQRVVGKQGVLQCIDDDEDIVLPDGMGAEPA